MSVSVVALTFSIPPIIKSWTATCEYFSNGYLVRVRDSKTLSMSGVSPKSRSASPRFDSGK